MGANDKYRRDSLDGGTTWGDPYQFRGTDGKNGTVDYSRVSQILQDTYQITKTSIGETSIESPKITGGEIYGAKMYTNDFSIYTMNGGKDGGLSLYGNFGDEPYHMLEIKYSAGDGAYVIFRSPAGADALWRFERTDFYGNIDFSQAKVSGIYATFA